jgi:hypothetical protein
MGKILKNLAEINFLALNKLFIRDTEVANTNPLKTKKKSTAMYKFENGDLGTT